MSTISSDICIFVIQVPREACFGAGGEEASGSEAKRELERCG